MNDLNHDGKDDYKDYIFFEENIERLEKNEQNQPKYWENRGGRKASVRVPFIVRIILAFIIVSICEAINFFLGLIALIVYIIIESCCK